MYTYTYMQISPSSFCYVLRDNVFGGGNSAVYH